MLYKNLPKSVGLRRITLHKSCSPGAEVRAAPLLCSAPKFMAPSCQVTYLLLVECSHFLEHIGEAANLLPVLRGRICGYTGIYRWDGVWEKGPL